MDKSIVAVVMGVIVSFITSAVIGFLLGLTLASGGMKSLLSPTFIATVLVSNAIGSIVGGWTTAKRAPHSPLTHALAFGVISAFLSMGVAMPSEIRQLQFLAAVALALFGGWISSPRRASVPPSATPIRDATPPSE